MARPTIEPVTDATLMEFSQFLHTHLEGSRAADEWARGLRNNWAADRPNYGFVVRDEGQIVGGIGAYYADRLIGGQPVKLCNITSWCVLDAFRQQSMRLAMAVISQSGYHFTDFSPTKVVGGTLKFFKFKELEEGVAVILNAPNWRQIGVQALFNPTEIQTALPASDLKIYQDHAIYPWLRQVVIGKPGHWCHVIYKQGVFKGVPSATILYLSDRKIFSQSFGRLATHLLMRGMVSTHVECRFLDEIPKPFKIRTGFNHKLFLSSSLAPDDIDYLYSETMALNL